MTTIIFSNDQSADIYRAAKLFASISPNNGLRRHNRYFPSFWGIDHNYIHVVHRYRNENYDECPQHRGEIRLVYDDSWRTSWTPEERRDGAIEALRSHMTATLNEIARRLDSEHADMQRIASDNAVMIDWGTDQYSFATPMGCYVRPSVSVRGARILATRDGINAEGYAAGEAAAKLRERHANRQVVIRDAIAAIETLASVSEATIA